MTHKAGYVTIVGNPNAGKSTLMNALLGEQLSIISPKAQTTRHRILGIYNQEDLQIVFSDTPGVMAPQYALQENMMDYVRASFADADAFLYLVTPEGEALQDARLSENLKQVSQPLIILLNKIDLCQPEELDDMVAHWHDEFPRAEILPLSALKKVNLDMLMQRLGELLPQSPPYFDKEELSDRSERFFAAEMIREQILLHYQKEIPYAAQVEVESFADEPKILRIQAIIYVERPTQKSIVIGEGGKMIKRTGTAARKRMEAFWKKKVFLELFVKIRKDWRKNDQELKRFGY